MLVVELFEHNVILTESAKRIWARKGRKVIKKFRCTTGRKKGRIVNTPADCGTIVDLKKRQQFKRVKAQKGERIKRKTLRTKKYNPASLRVQKMNKML